MGRVVTANTLSIEDVLLDITAVAAQTQGDPLLQQLPLTNSSSCENSLSLYERSSLEQGSLDRGYPDIVLLTELDVPAIHTEHKGLQPV